MWIVDACQFQVVQKICRYVSRGIVAWHTREAGKQERHFDAKRSTEVATSLILCTATSCLPRLTPDPPHEMAEIKKYTITEPYLDLSCALGEAPFFETSRHELRFVDLEKSRKSSQEECHTRRHESCSANARYLCSSYSFFNCGTFRRSGCVCTNGTVHKV